MDQNTKDIIRGQFGAAIETLENAIRACPEELWFDQTRYHKFWHMAFHTLFWLDYYLSDSFDDFKPPAPFGLEELDPAGAIPERAYTQEELLEYLEYCRKKCRDTIESMTDEKAGRLHKFRKASLSKAELLLYNMRHVQHHAAQLNLLLRQNIKSAPGWVFKAGDVI